jgi:hypothetical protein
VALDCGDLVKFGITGYIVREILNEKEKIKYSPVLYWSFFSHHLLFKKQYDLNCD